MSHIRINITENWNALSTLRCSYYKVLLALSARADSVGRCFPGVERIASDCDLHEQTVRAALKHLGESGYIKILRAGTKDPITGLSYPTVYMVSPGFLEIAAGCLQEAWLIWENCESFSYPNQQQQPAPLTNTNKPTPGTNNNNNKNNRSESEKAEGPRARLYEQVEQQQTAKSKGDDLPNDNQQRKAQQRSGPEKGSAKIKKSYTTPTRIHEQLPDPHQEQLAQRIQQYKMPIPMARGYVAADYEAALAAANQVDVADDIENRAAFFRYLLEFNMVDPDLPDALVEIEAEPSGKYSKDYSDFIES